MTLIKNESKEFTKFHINSELFPIFLDGVLWGFTLRLEITRNWRQHGRILNTVHVSGPANKHLCMDWRKKKWSCKQIFKNSLTATQSPLASKPKYWADLTSHILKYCIICWTSWTGFNCCEWTFLYLDSSFPFLLGYELQIKMNETKKRFEQHTKYRIPVFTGAWMIKC
jgi:hypothetical protein